MMGSCATRPSTVILLRECQQAASLVGAAEQASQRKIRSEKTAKNLRGRGKDLDCSGFRKRYDPQETRPGMRINQHLTFLYAAASRPQARFTICTSGVLSLGCQLAGKATATSEVVQLTARRLIMAVKLPRGAVASRLGKETEHMRKARREREVQRHKQQRRHQPRPVARRHNVRPSCHGWWCHQLVAGILSAAWLCCLASCSHWLTLALLTPAISVQLLESFGEALLSPLPENIQADLRARRQELSSLVLHVFQALQRLVHGGTAATPRGTI